MTIANAQALSGNIFDNPTQNFIFTPPLFNVSPLEGNVLQVYHLFGCFDGQLLSSSVKV